MKDRPPIRRPSLGGPSGFTLIELLVVISIMALLVALLLPTLASAKDASRALACLSNQRQIGIALESYATEFADYMPGGNQWWYPPQTNPNWEHFTGRLGLGGFVGAAVTYTTYMGPTGTYANQQSWTLFRCPGEQLGYLGSNNNFYVNTSVGLLNSWMLYRARSSYGYNQEVSKKNATIGGVFMSYYGMPRKGWSKGPERGTVSTLPTSRTYNLTPAEAALVMDNRANTTLFYSQIDAPDVTTVEDVPYAFRHFGLTTANVLYWDGHAESRKPYSVTGKPIWYKLFNTYPDGTPGA